MERITDAFVWPFRDPQWPSKIAILALILLIPIVGAINGLGWMLAALERLRAGDEKLPPANFDYLGRGFALFVVNLVYVLVLLVIGGALYGVSVLLLASQGQHSANPLIVALGLVLLLLAFGLVSLGSLAFTFLTPAIVLAVAHGGIVGGLRIDEVVQTAVRSPLNTLIAGLMLIAAGFIEGLGIWVCCIGILFTTAYALAMQAWIVRSFEMGSSPTT